MISVEKPGTPEELVHVGVLGMKWGVRRSRDTREFRKKFATKSERNSEITRARASRTKQKAAIERAGGKKTEKGQKLNAAYLKNPDRATARRLKSGEKVVATILAVLVAPITVGVGPGAALAVAGVNASRRRGIEEANAKRGKK